VIGVDTNILLRFFLRDDAIQSPRAVAFMQARSEADPATVSAVTLAEFIWVLRRSRKAPKERLIATMDAMLTYRELHVPDAEALHRALRRYEDGDADLPDYFIAELNAAEGGAPTYTFDARAAREPQFAPVP